LVVKEKEVSGFEGQIPGGLKPRVESKGEAQVRWASLIANLLRGWPFKMIISRPEEEHLAGFMSAVIRRWPYFATWKAPGK
jgi:hypothetical protein